MTAALTTRYGFRIRTRQGLLLGRLVIHGRDAADAERKLRQMYQHCQILECAALPSAPAVYRTPAWIQAITAK